MNTFNKIGSQNSDYIPEIDALRGLAVLVVILYHFFPEVFPGGFIGVDCFFVISGYLITKKLLDKNTIYNSSLIEFYKGRVLRILPATTFVLFSSMLFGWFVLLPHEYKQLGLEAAFASVFSTNFYLATESSYFATSASSRPLLHLWSIAIEEQFYFIWPLLLWQFRKWSFSIRFVTIFLFAFSILYGFVHSYIFLDEMYFNTMSRVWPILAGALVAQLEFNRKLNRTLSRILFFVCGGLIFLCGILFTDKLNWPGFFTFIPVLATMSILVLSNWTGRIELLQKSGLVLVGKASFSLYLWHWVIFSFSTILFAGQLTVQSLLFSILLTFLVSFLSFHYVENPMRKNGKVVMSLALFWMSGLIGFWIYHHEGFSFRNPDHLNSFSVRSLPSRPDPFFDCSDEYPQVNTPLCSRLEKTSAVLIGDSHAWHMQYGLANSKDPLFSKIELLAAGSCWPTLNVESRQGCQPFVDRYIHELSNRKTTKLVIMSFWSAVVEKKDGPIPEEMQKGLIKTIETLLSKRIRVVFLVDSVTFAGPIENCMKPSLAIRAYFQPNFSWCAGRTKSDSDRPHYMKIVKEISTQFQNRNDFYIVEQNSALCGESICPILDPQTGLFLYTDYNHLSKYGSLKAAASLISKIRAKWDDLD